MKENMSFTIEPEVRQIIETCSGLLGINMSEFIAKSCLFYSANGLSSQVKENWKQKKETLAELERARRILHKKPTKSLAGDIIVSNISYSETKE